MDISVTISITMLRHRVKSHYFNICVSSSYWQVRSRHYLYNQDFIFAKCILMRPMASCLRLFSMNVNQCFELATSIECAMVCTKEPVQHFRERVCNNKKCTHHKVHQPGKVGKKKTQELSRWKKKC